MSTKVSKKGQELARASAEIQQYSPEDLAFLHATLCQVHLPRSKVQEREFIRNDGAASLRIEAGSLYDGKKWAPQPLPYGVKPRLVLLHLNSYALRHKTKEVPVQDSLAAFLRVLGLASSGGPRGNYRAFRQQVNALAACKMEIGYIRNGMAITQPIDRPIKRFDAWLSTGSQRALWPGVMHLSDAYYDSLRELSVPLDPRAIGALSQSSLALDIYTWLAHRLHRVRNGGQTIHWKSLRGQFGSMYASPVNFKRKWKEALAQALQVYPDARIEVIPGGVRLRPSNPPILKTTVVSFSGAS